jgi:replicative DNA helicase
MSILGSVLIQPDVLAVVLEECRDEDFYRDAHRLLFRAICRLSERGVEIEPVALSEYLRREGTFDMIGGAGYLSQLWDYVPSAANIAYHARIVADFARLRRLKDAAAEIARSVHDRVREVPEIIADAEGRVLAVAESRIASGGAMIGSLLWPTMEHIESAERGIECGLEDVDALTYGFGPKNLYLVAARPSMGKSAFMVGAALEAAIRSAKRVAFFSTEAGELEWMERALAYEARVNVRELKDSKRRKAKFDESGYGRIEAAAGRLQSAPLMLDVQARSVLEIRSRARRMKRDGGLDVVFVDHIHEMHGPGESEERVYNQIAKDLKALSKELDIPVVAAAQLSRSVEQRPEKRPIMSDLRQSGGLEEAADFVGLLYRPEYYFGPTRKEGKGANTQTFDLAGLAEMIVGKNRNGPTGTATLRFVKEYTRFEQISGRKEDR